MTGSAGNSRFGRRDAGFTLVEALVSLMLLALITLLLPGAIKTGKRGWETAEALTRRAADEASLSFLRHRLAEATPVYDKDISGRARIAFSGSASSLMFVAPSPSGPAGAGLYRFTLLAVKDEPAGALRLSIAPFRSDGAESAAAGGDERVLMPATDGLALRYLDWPEGDDDPVWVDLWPHDDRLPGLVEIVMGGASGQPTYVVGLKLAPRK